MRGGTARVEGLAERSTDSRSASARSGLPANAVATRVADVDPGDNQDGFAVVLAARSGGGDGGSGDGDGGGGESGGGTGGGDGGLPVTGPQAGLIGGVGIAALVAGGVLFLVSRRRRMVLVTPDDEPPAA
ncbi:LPXTG cell wall anchor domain-containing protein [Micromonospora sp. WMMD980]|uniref:LPXTG cell wall anchor domain-containing protein n=1 Tax=Micromonospora sp. WMMD980 TaxID=3016088 RepID=UPI0024164E15|nr:LPXTG cell wall anchor domain-containing protein [Micromonospora sp. WMMD980]MDG4803261.1 LPXTG cell wall anchor domain-containing protein [Micromonospora sp. WMMD980]